MSIILKMYDDSSIEYKPYEWTVTGNGSITCGWQTIVKESPDIVRPTTLWESYKNLVDNSNKIKSKLKELKNGFRG